MIKHLEVPIDKIKISAFSVQTDGGKALRLQDLLKRMKAIMQEEGLPISSFVFLENPITEEIKMEIV